MTRYVIALSELGIKNENLIYLIKEHLSDIATMFKSTSSDIFNSHLDLVEYSELFSKRENVAKALRKADDILIKNEEQKIKTTYITAPTYPTELARIDNPPAIIYYKGNEFTDISDKAIACVGTRNPTRLSYNSVNYLIPQWVKEGCVIVSGLACGVDKISHQACVSAGGKTIAVLAHGLDTIYPKENEPLAERILETGGILMSEYPVGTKADRYRFVDRNRLIVGMSKVVIIYECNASGGTMHNVKYASRQHKPIFCPALGYEINEVQTGTKQLLDEKTAIEIKNGKDIWKVLDKLGVKQGKNQLSNLEIKRIYLNAVLFLMNNSAVLENTIRELHLNISIPENIKDVYNLLISCIENNMVNIDNLIQSLVKNNIASVSRVLAMQDEERNDLNSSKK